MFEISFRLQVDFDSIFLAIKLMDKLVSLGKVNANEYNIYVAVCLLIACKNYNNIVKSREKDERIPFISKFIKNSPIYLRESDIKRLEIKILKDIDWKIQKNTYFDLTKYLISKGIIFSNDLWNLNSSILLSPLANKILQEKNENNSIKISTEGDKEIKANYLCKLSKVNIYECLLSIENNYFKICEDILYSSNFL